ncbi:DsrE/DsrF/DrsH-like family protein [Paenibacillus sophorae]|uniref:DsrE/DsrF/DrsH-like family protein n=2 Tax=Paenibacillus sophorae TaxID=1333845 RepID=A0ABX8HI57_9BACL|nr:DsrE/DsrF/DrsH-like family protein [Paenibacillus sophorae]
MIRSIMRRKNVDSLEKLIENAAKSGVRMIACGRTSCQKKPIDRNIYSIGKKGRSSAD